MTPNSPSMKLSGFVGVYHRMKNIGKYDGVSEFMNDRLMLVFEVEQCPKLGMPMNQCRDAGLTSTDVVQMDLQTLGMMEKYQRDSGVGIDPNIQEARQELNKIALKLKEAERIAQETDFCVNLNDPEQGCEPRALEAVIAKQKLPSVTQSIETVMFSDGRIVLENDAIAARASEMDLPLPGQIAALDNTGPAARKGGGAKTRHNILHLG